MIDMQRGFDDLAFWGPTANPVCEANVARLIEAWDAAGTLGYDVTVVLDATRTFDLDAEIAGVGRVRRTAEELMATTALVLHGGGFARIAMTADLVL